MTIDALLNIVLLVSYIILHVAVTGFMLFVFMRFLGRAMESACILIGEGVYDQTIFSFENDSDHDPMAYITGRQGQKITVIMFTDGESYTLPGWERPPFPIGTRIRIWRYRTGSIIFQPIKQEEVS